MDIEGSKKVMVDILLELGDLAFEQSVGKKGNSVIIDMNITKSVRDVLSYIVDRCSQGLIPSQELRGSIEDNEKKSTLDHYSSTSAQSEKETRNNSDEHLSEIEGNNSINYHSGMNDHLVIDTDHTETEINNADGHLFEGEGNSSVTHSEMDDHLVIGTDHTESRQWKPDVSSPGKIGNKLIVDEDDNFVKNKYNLHDDKVKLFDIKEAHIEEVLVELVEGDTEDDHAKLPIQEQIVHSCQEDKNKTLTNIPNTLHKVRSCLEHKNMNLTIIPNPECSDHLCADGDMDLMIIPNPEQNIHSCPEDDDKDPTNLSNSEHSIHSCQEDEGADQTYQQSPAYNVHSCQRKEDMDRANKLNPMPNPSCLKDKDMDHTNSIEVHLNCDIKTQVQNNVTTTVEKLYKHDFGIEGQTLFEGHLSVEIPILEEQHTDLLKITKENKHTESQTSKQCAEKDNSILEIVQCQVFDLFVQSQKDEGKVEQELDQNQVTQQNELKNQKFEASFEQEDVTEESLYEQCVSQDQQSQETQQEQVYIRNIEKDEEMNCQENIMKGNQCKECVKQDPTIEIPESSKCEMSEQSVDYDKSPEGNEQQSHPNSEFVELEEFSKLNNEKKKTSELNDEQNTTSENSNGEQHLMTIESTEQNKTLCQNETKQYQTTIKSTEREKSENLINDQEQMIMKYNQHYSSFEQNGGKDHVDAETVKQDSTSEQWRKRSCDPFRNCSTRSNFRAKSAKETSEQDPTSKQNTEQCRTAEIIDKDFTSKKNEEKNLKPNKLIEQDLSTEQRDVYEQTAEDLIEQDHSCLDSGIQNHSTIQSTEQYWTCEENQEQDKIIIGSVGQYQTSEQGGVSVGINGQESITSKQDKIQTEATKELKEQDQTYLKNWTQNQANEEFIENVQSDKSYMKDKELDQLVIESAKQEQDPHEGGPLGQVSQQSVVVGKHTIEGTTLQEEKMFYEDENAKQPNIISESESNNFKHYHSTEYQPNVQCPITITKSHRPLADECDTKISTYLEMEGPESSFDLRKHLKDQTLEAKQNGALQCKQVQNRSEEMLCGSKRTFAGIEESKFMTEEPNVKRRCINMQYKTRIDDQAVPSVEAAEQILPQEDACIYSCSRASKKWNENSSIGNEMCAEVSAVDTDKQGIQNDDGLPDEDTTVREGGAFKWKYVPSFDTDAIVPKKDEHDGYVQLIQVTPLPLCRKPRRIGLSKRQKIQHLHPNFKPH
ncbi:LOW QUALITY PROTEIN: myb-like protein X [Argopecten irradians]|uniref:LOW QUALITY PROTEIN: myb-like protein X n=1 Tax=Argopecten irradians TaxID=31199 RepID=UPI003720EC67